MMKKLFLGSCCGLLFGCATPREQVDLGGALSSSFARCGIESFLNRYASYRCDFLELEDSSQSLDSTQHPLHNMQAVSLKGYVPRLLVVDEKILQARVREVDQEVVCKRRLKVVLNPGTGDGVSYQKGWMNYRPKCFQFYKLQRPIKNRKIMTEQRDVKENWLSLKKQ